MSRRVHAAVPATCLGIPDLRGIYAIRCLPLNKVYVGQAASFPRRWMTHQIQLAAGTHLNGNLQAAWRLYGPRAFTFEILEVVETPGVTALTLAEQRWMDKFPRRFNVRPAGTDEYLAKRQAAVQADHATLFCLIVRQKAPRHACRCKSCRYARSQGL